MGVKARQVVSDSPKAEVGEIDTRAPFESVKAAVTLFGEGAFSAEKAATRKPRSQSAERALVKETQLHLAQKELHKLKEQLRNAESTRVQALTELDIAKKTVEVLTREFNTINESKDLALKATEAAKGQTKAKQLEEVNSSNGIGKDGATKELDSAREHYAAAITELDAAKQELRRIRKDFDASMDAKISAFQREAEATELSGANEGKATQLSKEIEAVQESLVHVKLATEQAQQEESNIRVDKDNRRQSYRSALEETEKRLASLKTVFDPEVNTSLETNLAETTAEIGAIKKEMEDVRTSELESVANVTTELDGAKGVLQKVAEEENSLKSLVESLKLELESVQKEHAELKDKDADVESLAANLHVQLQNCRAELEAALTAEARSRSASDDLASTLQQLSSESEAALQEAEATKKKAEELRSEAEAARVTLAEAEKKLQVALGNAEEAKAAEARALDQIKEISEKASACRASTSEHGANITLSTDEYNSLSRKVEECEELTEMKVAAAMAQVEAVRSSENEAIKKLEATRKEMEDMASATEEALKRAQMAEGAKKAVEGEMRRWREREQKKAAEAASRILAETQIPKAQTPPRPRVPTISTTERSEVHKKVYRPSPTRRTLLSSVSGIFHRKKNQVDGGSPSYLPGEKTV